MPQPSSERPARLDPGLMDTKVRSLATNLGAMVHTHTARVPYGGDSEGAVTDPAALSMQRQRAAFVASTTIEGPYQLAVSAAGSAIGVAMTLGNDMGLSGGFSLLDLALNRDADALQRTGLSATTANALCQAAQCLAARIPDGPLPDQPTLFFEAGGEEVAITPLVSVRVLQQINARLADASRSDQARLALPIAQGGANPQNVAHYVNSSPRRAGEILVNRNSRRGHYNALRIRCPHGVRSRVERDLARIVATCSPTSVCHVSREAARAFRSRAVTGLLLPGATIRLAVIRTAEQRDAGVVARQYLARLYEARAYAQGRGRNQGYALDRLPGWAVAWMEQRATAQDLAVLATGLAEDLIRKIEAAAHGVLPPVARNVLRTAMAQTLAEAT